MISTILRWTLNLLFSLVGAIIVWLVRMAFRLAAWVLRMLWRHPRTTAALSVFGGGVLTLGWQWVAIIVGIVMVSGSVWKAAHQASFERIVLPWLRTWLRRWWTYRRRWQHVMTRCGLVVEEGDQQHVPDLRKVSTTTYWDRLELRLQVGQEVDDFRQAREKLRHAFDAERATVREVKPRGVGLDLMRRDPFLFETVPAATMPRTSAEIDYTALSIGLTEHLAPFTVSIVGGHLAVSGATGAGKAGVEWGILRALAPAIADGTVRPVFIDPKGKELAQGLSLVKAGVYGTRYSEDGRRVEGPEQTGDYAVTCADTVTLLARLAGELEVRNSVSGERDFTPSPTRPLVLIFIDELAPLLEYWPRSKRDKIGESLGLLLTQGRAEGFIVVGEIQEPTKDIFKVRDLFFRRLGLRLPTEAFTDAALAEHATDLGAACHTIPESLPGVLYAVTAGAKEAVRARIGHVTDDDITDLCAYVRELRTVTPITSRRPAVGHYTGEAA